MLKQWRLYWCFVVKFKSIMLNGWFILASDCWFDLWPLVMVNHGHWWLSANSWWQFIMVRANICMPIMAKESSYCLTVLIMVDKSPKQVYLSGILTPLKGLHAWVAWFYTSPPRVSQFSLSVLAAATKFSEGHPNDKFSTPISYICLGCWYNAFDIW